MGNERAGCLGYGLLALFTIALIPYCVWAYSYVLLTGYNWFFVELIGIKFAQIHFAALSSMVYLLRTTSISFKKDDRESDDMPTMIGKLIAYGIGPWISLLVLYIFTLFL